MFLHVHNMPDALLHKLGQNHRPSIVLEVDVVVLKYKLVDINLAHTMLDTLLAVSLNSTKRTSQHIIFNRTLKIGPTDLAKSRSGPLGPYSP
ncbi:uncharacterized protein RCC_02142 [Ramularia collo-cygni]|uniref:Uncharacterized protein n=1 Tax=Ramularia collo-cygni TaxID=112498 RepID=A0A2D3UTV6_9PEZI|nr:uncharacterized protein RCC_02142 [Ramularia collo-cygni]CZT16300.1 uncharacterized protein RCC_02142 [Ramularia collo-cygni]